MSGRAPARTRALLLSIVGLALAVRIANVLLMRASPIAEQPSMDALYHVQWAQAFAEGRSFLDGPFFRAPLYPWLLGTVFKLFGDSLLIPRLLQAGLGALATALTFLAARRAFDATTGLLAAFLVATNWVLVYFDNEFLIPTLIVPLNLLALWLTLGVPAPSTGPSDEPVRPASGSTVRAALAGAAWGLTCIARPNPLLFMPLACLWITASLGGVRRGWRAAAGFLLGLALPILPLTVYNAAQGDRVLIASQAGVNFWIGNNPQSDGSTAIVPGTRGGWWEGFEDSIAMAERAQGRPLRPSEVSSYWMGRSLSWFREAPAAALRHWLWKARLLVTDYELGNNQDVRFFATRYGVARYLPPGFGVFGGFGLLLGLAVVGLAVSARGGARRFPLWGFLAVYALGIVAFFVCSRFRAPLVPLLAIYAAAALTWLARNLVARKFTSLLALLPAVLVAWGSMRIPAQVETTDANGFLQLSLSANQSDNVTEALEYARAAVNADDDNRMALRQLGRVLIQTGRPQEAVAPLRHCVSLEDRDIDSLLALSEALRLSQDLQAAAPWASRAIQLAPQLASPHGELGRIRYAERRLDEAAQSFALAVEREPDSFAWQCSLALSLEAAGRPDEAFPVWRRAVELGDGGEPAFVELAHEALIRALRARGLDEEALRLERSRP